MAALDADAGTGLLVVDQFEELFTACEDLDERERFIDRLLATERPVAIAMRADFYGDCAGHLGLATAVAANQVLLGPMRDDELRRAIVEPARQAGLRVEPGLVDVLVAEVERTSPAPCRCSPTPCGRPGSGATAARSPSPRTTRPAASIAPSPTPPTASSPSSIPSGRELARRLLLRMVQPGDGTADTRRRAPLDELRSAGGDTARVTDVLDALAAARLVTVDGTSAEMAHEALIREWPALRSWLDADRDGLRLHRQVTEAAAAWDELGREPAELYRGPRLAAAIDWRDGGPQLVRLEAEFLDAVGGRARPGRPSADPDQPAAARPARCRGHRSRRRRRRRVLCRSCRDGGLPTSATAPRWPGSRPSRRPPSSASPTSA